MEGKEIINEKFKDMSTRTFKVTVPMSVWEEWNKDCESQFNGTRYLKMKFDHEFRKQFGPITELVIADLDDLKERLSLIEEMVVGGFETKTVHVEKQVMKDE